MSFQQFLAEMIGCAVKHEMSMTGFDANAQARYMISVFEKSDAVFVIFPSEDTPTGVDLYVAKGAGVLAGSGFDLKVIEAVGQPPEIKKRRLRRDLRVAAFHVNSYLEARFVDIAYGDSEASRQARRSQQRDGGRQAIENMRQSSTPAGRTYLKSIAHGTPYTPQ